MKKLLFAFLSLIFFVSWSSAQSNKNMVLIPCGEFIMGKDTENGSKYSPAHTVKLDSFYIDTYEVTNREYLKFCKETEHKLPEFWNTDAFRCGEKYPDYPVVGVTWWDAKKYADWAGKRLATEAEWEYAARGGLTGKEYPNGNEWTKEGAKQDSAGWKNLIDPVGKFEPNGYGLYDMAGNVWEWVFDRYSVDYYSSGENDNPKGPGKGSYAVIRSGSWHSGPMCKRVYYRQAIPSNWVGFAVGFRCVKDVEKP